MSSSREGGASTPPELPPTARRVIHERRDQIFGALPPPEIVNSGRTDTRGRVVFAAIGLFGRKGFEACTMRDLAGAARIKAPALYNHFGSKEDILAEAIQYALSTFFLEVLEPLSTEPSGLWLERIVRRHTLFQLENLELALANDLILSGEHLAGHLSADDAKKFTDVQVAYMGIMRALVQASTGAWKSERVLVAAYAAVAVCDRSSAWYRPGGPLSPHEVANLNAELIAQMLAPTGSEPSRR